jgi:hypothetical protein
MLTLNAVPAARAEATARPVGGRRCRREEGRAGAAGFPRPDGTAPARPDADAAVTRPDWQVWSAAGMSAPGRRDGGRIRALGASF